MSESSAHFSPHPMWIAGGAALLLVAAGCAKTPEPEEPPPRPLQVDPRGDVEPRNDDGAGLAARPLVEAPEPQLPRRLPGRLEPENAPAALAEPLAAPAAPATPPPAVPLADLIEQVERSVVRLDVTGPHGGAVGSGFLADKTGVVVTNYHVIEGAEKAEATFNDKSRVRVTGILATNPEKDIAVIQIESKKRSDALPLCPQLPRKGEQVVAFGAPKGLSFSVTKGTVSALRLASEMKDVIGEKKGNDYQLIQTDAPISPGNSGGPLVDDRGRVVGINTFTRVEGQNLNFAVSAIDVSAELKKGLAAPVKAFNRANLPQHRRGGMVPDPENRPPEGGTIAAALERHKKSWVAAQKILLSVHEREIKLIEGDIKASERVIAAVREGGPEVPEILKQFPYGKTRYTWLKGARAYVAAQQERIKQHQVELALEERFLNDELYPPPRLRPKIAKVSDWGNLPSAGVIGQILDNKSFIARIEGVSVHCRNLDVSDVADGKTFGIDGLCVISGKFTYTTMSGARRTILSLEPLDEKLLPAAYLEVQAKRAAILAEREAEREEEWKRTVARSERAMQLKIGFPRLNTLFEAETILEFLEGGIPTPNFPKRYKVETSEQLIPRSPGLAPLSAVHTRWVETEESKRWRAEQIREFNAKKAIFPAIMLVSLIDELSDRVDDVALVRPQREQLKADLLKLEELAFERYGLTSDRLKVIPWSNTEKREVIDHLKRMAIQYGRLEQTALLELARVDQPDDEEKEKDRGGELKRLKEKLRLKTIALEREKKNLAKVDRTAQSLLEKEVAELKKQIEAAEVEMADESP